ncbi:hypothetical protein QC763_119120 [Podospora pseudopauciseta]|uniref:Exosome complex protein n=1 Tax=Podospora pseudopauciseta TaxID=2093780 RepID=A0ABR0I1P6_9PEZI|nr:hypothetical protein QC763_119120 [Podospora pseudopauciseta]
MVDCAVGSPGWAASGLSSCAPHWFQLQTAARRLAFLPHANSQQLGPRTNTPVDIFAVWITFKRRLSAKTDGTSNFDDFIHQTTLGNLLSSSLDLLQTDISSFRVKLTRIASTMDVSDLTPELEQLELDLNTLHEVLQPLLSDVGDVSSKMPLLDKAKLYVLVCYAIESLIFSSLRLNGADAKSHPVFTELTRVRQYFEKIQKLESPPEERENTVNTEAVARFVRNDLADNKDIKNKLTELIAKEKAKAEAKAATAAAEKKRPAEDSTSEVRPEEAGNKIAKRPKRDGSKKRK